MEWIKIKRMSPNIEREVFLCGRHEGKWFYIIGVLGGCTNLVQFRAVSGNKEFLVTASHWKDMEPPND